MLIVSIHSTDTETGHRYRALYAFSMKLLPSSGHCLLGTGKMEDSKDVFYVSFHILLDYAYHVSFSTYLSLHKKILNTKAMFSDVGQHVQ